MSDQPNQQPAEAVSEAAREATETFRLSGVNPKGKWDIGSKADKRLRALIQRAITAATADQQAEIAALREALAKHHE